MHVFFNPSPPSPPFSHLCLFLPLSTSVSLSPYLTLSPSLLPLFASLALSLSLSLILPLLPPCRPCNSASMSASKTYQRTVCIKGQPALAFDIGGSDYDTVAGAALIPRQRLSRCRPDPRWVSLCNLHIMFLRGSIHFPRMCGRTVTCVHYYESKNRHEYCCILIHHPKSQVAAHRLAIRLRRERLCCLIN